MIPAFDTRGLLPAGVHDCTLQQFQGAFAINPRREQLFASLIRCLQLMRDHGLDGALLLDGSYATDKEQPRDMEVTLDVRQQSPDIQGRALLFHVKHHSTLDKMGIDWYPTIEGVGSNDFTLFFQYVGEKTAAAKRCDPKDLKGILRISTW